MKRLFTLFLLSLGLYSAAFAQSTFEVSATSVWTILPGGDDDVDGHIVIHNPTNAVQTIKWERTIMNITPGCETQVCDLNLCYLAHISSKTFDIDPDSSGNIFVHFRNLDLIPDASGLVHLKMYNTSNPADSVVIAYLFTPETSDTENPLPAATVQMFPNPATDYFLLNNAEAVQRIRLFSLDSREVARYTANPGQQYSLASLPDGSYVIVLEDKNGRVFQALPVVKK